MRKPKRSRGIVFITAIVALSVMLIIGVTFIQLSMQRLSEARRALNAVHALATADAGINYMLWNQKHPDQSQARIADTAILPATTDLTALSPATVTTALRQSAPNDLGNGDQFAVWLLKYSLPTSLPGTFDGYQIVAKGSYRGYTRAIRTIVRAPSQVTNPTPYVNPPPPPVLNYALFSGTGLTISGTTDVSGDVGCNADLAVTSGSAHITGNAYAGGRITTKNSANINGMKYEHQPQAILSDIIQMANLMAYAAAHGGEVYTGTKHYWGEQPVSNRVIYVKGDVIIDANTHFSDIVTIVAEGNVTINGNVSSVGPPETSNLFVVSPNTITFKFNGNADIYATFIAPGVNASFNAAGNANLLGAVISNTITGGGTFNIVYRRPNSNAVIVPPPPVITGDDSLAWTIAAWQEI